jgi:hypothetical protein
VSVRHSAGGAAPGRQPGPSQQRQYRRAGSCSCRRQQRPTLRLARRPRWPKQSTRAVKSLSGPGQRGTSLLTNPTGNNLARISYLQSALRTGAYDYRRGPRSVSRSRRRIGDAFTTVRLGRTGDGGCLRLQVYAHALSHVATAVPPAWCSSLLRRSRRGSGGG